MLKTFLITIGLMTSLITTTYKAKADIVYHKDGLYIAEDTTGNKYAFEAYGFKKGESIILTIDNNHTPFDREDDLIIDIRR